MDGVNIYARGSLRVTHYQSKHFTGQVPNFSPIKDLKIVHVGDDISSRFSVDEILMSGV